MSERSGTRNADHLAAGREALAAGRWPDAVAAFRRSLAAAEEPEAFEGLSWAAWWLDDAEVVFASRERAYRLYRARGEPAAAARMAIWLAIDQLDFRGARAVANGWLQRAYRLLQPLPPCPEHGWLAFEEGYLALAGGDTAGACERAAVTRASGRAHGIPDLEMLGLALEGAALVRCARLDEGMGRLDEAAATALEGEATVPISIGWTFCMLVGACTAALDFGRASEWCDRVAAFADRYGSRWMLAFCRSEYGAVHLWRGSWSEADALLQASVEDFTRSRPAWVGGALVGLAELRRRQGQAGDAERLLDEAGASSGAHLCRARLALDADAAQEAAELAERLLRGLGDERLLDRAPALELLVHARARRGELDQARQAAAALRDVEQRVGTSALRACADRADGVLAAAGGEHERAQALLEDAIDGFEHGGGDFEAARTRLDLAACLAAQGRAEPAVREARAALAQLVELGAGPDAARARRLAGTPPDDPLAALTRREREVLALLAEGLTNRQIAERLVLSEHTVHRHVTNLLRKLDLPSRTAAAALAARQG